MTDKTVTAEQAREALLPCPHCGDGAALCTSPAIFAGQHYPDYPGQIHGYRIECAGNCHSMTCWWHTVDEARTAWNRRFIDQHSQPADPLDDDDFRELDAALPDEIHKRMLNRLVGDLAHQRDDNRRLYRTVGATPAGMDEAVERIVVGLWALSALDEGAIRGVLTAAGLPALVAECERLKHESAEKDALLVHWHAEIDRQTERAIVAESRAEQAEAERDRLLNALNAALGVGGDFPLRQDGDPPYWWRDWLQKFAGLAYNGKRFVIEQGGGT